MFGRATITLGIGPHSSLNIKFPRSYSIMEHGALPLGGLLPIACRRLFPLSV